MKPQRHKDTNTDNRYSCLGCLNILLFIFLFLNSAAASEFKNTATTGFNFLSIPASARSAALGETGISLPDPGADALFINPALSAFYESDRDLAYTYGDWYLDTRQNAAAAIMKIPALGSFGLSLYHFDFGSTPQTRNFAPEEVSALRDGDPNTYKDLGEYHSAAFTAGFHFARQTTEAFAYGLTVNYIQENIAEYSASNVAVDVGFMYKTGVASLRVGSFLKNFGLETAYKFEKFKLPQKLSLGISGEIWGDISDPNHLTLLLEAVNPNDTGEHLHFGAELQLAGILALRGGYKTAYDAEGFSLGLGTNFILKGRNLKMDLSYLPHDYLQSNIRTTLSVEL